MSDIVSAEAAAQEGEALLPSAELAKNLGLTLAASVVLTFSTIVYMQGGLHSYFYAQSAYALGSSGMSTGYRSCHRCTR